MNSTFAKSMKINFISSENKANKHEKRSMKSRLKGRGWLSELVYCVGMKLHFHYFRLRIGFCIADKIELSLSLPHSNPTPSLSGRVQTIINAHQFYRRRSVANQMILGATTYQKGREGETGESAAIHANQMSFKFFTVQTHKTMQSRQTNSKQINTTGQRWQTQQDTQDTPPDSQTNKRTYLQLQLPTGRELWEGGRQKSRNVKNREESK